MSRIMLYVIAIFVIVFPVMANSAPVAQVKQYHNQEMIGFQSGLASAAAVLEGKQENTWTKLEIEDYLFNALYAIYQANIVFTHENGRLPNSAEELRDSGVLSPWPGNPFNKWEPITWRTSTEKFMPGDLVIQICPSSWYSGVNNPRPISNVLSINGPTSDFEPTDTNALVPYFEWATIPQGTAFIVGFYREPAWKVLEKQRKKAAENK